MEKKKRKPPHFIPFFPSISFDTREACYFHTGIHTHIYTCCSLPFSLSVCVLSKTAENEVKKKKSKSTRHFKVDEAGNIAQSVQPIYMWEDMK